MATIKIEGQVLLHQLPGVLNDTAISETQYFTIVRALNGYELISGIELTQSNYFHFKDVEGATRMALIVSSKVTETEYGDTIKFVLQTIDGKFPYV